MNGKSVGILNPWLQVPIYAILLFEGAALVARSFLDVQLRNDGMKQLLASDVSYLIVPPLLFVLMYPVIKNHGRLLLPLIGFRKLTFRLVFAGLALGVSTYLASVFVNVALSAWEISSLPNSLLAAGLKTSWSCESLRYLLLGVGVSVFLIPVIEETINRGFLLGYFLHKGRTIAVLMSSALFAAFHQPHAIPPAFVIGIYLAFLALNCGSLLPGMIAHGVHNLLVQLDVHCISIDWVPTTTVPEIAASGTQAVVATIVILIVAAVVVSPRVTGARPLPL